MISLQTSELLPSARQRTLERSASVLDRGTRFSFTDRSGTSNANDHSESRKKPFRSFSFLLGLLGIFGVLRNRNPCLTSPASVTTYEPRLWKGTNHVCSRAQHPRRNTRHRLHYCTERPRTVLSGLKLSVPYTSRGSQRLSFFIARRNFSFDRFLVAPNEWRITRCNWNCRESSDPGDSSLNRVWLMLVLVIFILGESCSGYCRFCRFCRFCRILIEPSSTRFLGFSSLGKEISFLREIMK